MNTDTLLPRDNTPALTGVNGYAGKPIAEIITNGFFTVDKNWTVQYWNKAAEKILRVHAADIVGKNLWAVFVAIIPLEFYPVYHKAFEKNIPLHFQEYWGEMGAWFDVIIYYCDDTLSVSFKSSDRSVNPDHPTTVEQALQIKTGLYKFVTEVTNDCLWEWDLLTKEMFWIDGGHRRIFGYPVENALLPQSFWEEKIHPEDKIRLLSKLKKIVRERSVTSWEDEYRFKKADGVYAWVHDRGHIIYENETCRMIGATQDISEKVFLQKQLMAERLEREKENASVVFTAQEKERATIGKELLDNVNHVLGAVKLYIEMAKKDDINRESLLETSCNYIVQAMENVGRITKSLTPFIQLLGLVRSIKILTDEVSAGSAVRFTIHDYGMDLEILEENLQMNIFRIVQQQVNNIVQYANATLASIDISRQDDEIVLFVSDNGAGCDLEERKNGPGIKNIISRANLYNGSVTTLSSPGEGYTLQVICRLHDW